MAHDPSINTLRGDAIILVVAYHAVGYVEPDGPIVNSSDWREYFCFTFRYVRMPLFTVLSGYVYALHPATRHSFGRFLRGKARRILLPLFTVSTLTYLLMAVMPGVNTPAPLEDIWKIYVFRFNQWWFLHSIAAVFLFVGIVDAAGWMRTPGRWLVWLAVAVAISALVPATRLSVSGAPYLLPYFLLGCGFRRFCQDLSGDRIPLVIAGIFLAGLAAQQLVWFGVLDLDVHNRGPLGLVVGLTGTFTLLHFRHPLPLLPALGHYSYSIYLFHMFGLAVATRLVAPLDSAAGEGALFLVKCACGLLLPIVAEKILVRNKTSRLLFLGQR